MSPRRITRLALTLATLSLLGIAPMVAFRPGWGALTWWPAMGLGLALLLLVVAYTWGALLATRQRMAMVDKLNDCYAGAPDTTDSNA